MSSCRQNASPPTNFLDAAKDEDCACRALGQFGQACRGEGAMSELKGSHLDMVHILARSNYNFRQKCFLPIFEPWAPLEAHAASM